MAIKVSILCLVLSLYSCGKRSEDSKSSSKNPYDSTERTIKNAKEQKDVYNAIVADEASFFENFHKLDQSLDFHFVDGDTPLTKAIKRCSTKLIEYVIKNTKDINRASKLGETPLNLAIKNQKITIIDQLIARDANLDLKDENENLPLFNAIIFDEEIAVTLVKHGANFRLKEKSGSSLKSFAKAFGHNKLYNLITKAEAHKNINLEHIEQAIFEADITFIRYLMQRHPQYSDIINENNLLIDVLDINEEISRRNILVHFLESKININNTKNEIPLLYALRNGLASEAKLLLTDKKQSVDVTFFDKLDRDALYYSAILLNEKLVSIIYNKLEKIVDDSSSSAYPHLQATLRSRRYKACKKLPRKISYVKYSQRNAYRKIKSLLRCDSIL